MEINELLKLVCQQSASDLHLKVGLAPIIRLHGQLVSMDLPVLNEQAINLHIAQLLEGKAQLMSTFKTTGEVDFIYELEEVGRFRINVFQERGYGAVALRVIGNHIQSMEALGLPRKTLETLASHTKGLILVTGPTGSGKTTTLATMIDYINQTYAKHILTIEEPIEFVHASKKSIVSQREIGRDTKNYQQALKSALREDPDVILIGEMRDLETISAAITAAETGHLVLSTLHTTGAVQTIDRIIGAFPTNEQSQIRMQLSQLIKGIISQQLLPHKNMDERLLALEIMLMSPAISHLIREEKNHQIYSHIQTGTAQGMMTMEASIITLYQEDKINLETAYSYSQLPEELKRLLNRY